MVMLLSIGLDSHILQLFIYISGYWDVRNISVLIFHTFVPQTLPLRKGCVFGYGLIACKPFTLPYHFSSNS